MLAQHKALLRRRRHSQLKAARMIAITILAFLISWSPYCIVSLIAICNSTYILADGEAEIPELMAKSSVIYNPLVYAVMNGDFRKTAKRLLRERFCYKNKGGQETPDIEMMTTKLHIFRMATLSSKESGTSV